MDLYHLVELQEEVYSFKENQWELWIFGGLMIDEDETLRC